MNQDNRPLFSTSHPFGQPFNVPNISTAALASDQYAIVADMGRNFRKAFTASRWTQIANMIGETWKRPETEAEWQELFDMEDRVAAIRKDKTDKRRKAHAMMWLSIYSPGVVYDPVKHWIALPEEEEEWE